VGASVTGTAKKKVAPLVTWICGSAAKCKPFNTLATGTTVLRCVNSLTFIKDCFDRWDNTSCAANHHHSTALFPDPGGGLVMYWPSKEEGNVSSGALWTRAEGKNGQLLARAMCGASSVTYLHPSLAEAARHVAKGKSLNITTDE
jgi:hypothetical protein